MSFPSVRGKTVVLDANLIVVYICGIVRRISLGYERPVTDYFERDFEALAIILSQAHACVTTPAIISEVSNLLGKAGEYRAAQYRAKLGELLSEWKESYKPSGRYFADSDNIAVKFGLADKTILDLAKQRYVIITADKPLVAMLKSRTLDVIYWSEVPT